MARITASVYTSHVHAIGAALDLGKSGEPYWQPVFKGYEFSKQWLRENTPTNASVGTLEVGIIGFHSQRRMIDFAGLIQPEVGSQFTQYATYEDSAKWAAEHYHPDYLALFEGDLPRFEHGYIAQHCTMIQSFPANPYLYSSYMNVYACR